MTDHKGRDRRSEGLVCSGSAYNFGEGDGLSAQGPILPRSDSLSREESSASSEVFSNEIYPELKDTISVLIDEVCFCLGQTTLGP